MPEKLLVISVDAMHTDDIPFAKTLPGFSRVLTDAAVAEIEGVYPSVTYPNHASQITGCSPATTGIYNNVQFQPGNTAGAEWFWDSRLIQVPTIFDAAHDAGLTTAAVQWPVTAKARSIDWLVPEIASPQVFNGLEDQYRQTTNSASFERYVLPNLHLVHTDRAKGKYLDFVDHVAAQILTHERPDVMFVHLVALDFARHAHGAYGSHVQEALRVVDDGICGLLSALDASADLASTNIAIVSDHGQIDTVQQTNLNTVFAEAGFLRTDAGGGLIDYDVYCLSAGLSGQLFLAQDITAERRTEVGALLAQIEADRRYRIERIWTAEQTLQEYGLDGPFDWVVESEPGVAISSRWDRDPVVLAGDADFPSQVGSHGHAPRHGGQPVFIASGPAFRNGVDLGRQSMLDEAPTFATVLGVELPSAQGTVMSELLTAVRA